MLGVVLILLMALVLLAYVAVPLLFPSQADPLPDARDPLLTELEEEKDALFRAIRELAAREDLPAARREALKARYEAKAARTLRALDERQARLAGQAPPAAPKPRRAPVAALTLLAGLFGTALVMGGFVLPRVGQDATITTGDLEAGRELRDLQRAADQNPSEETLLALADAYWRFEEVEAAERVYLQAAALTPPSALAWQRLGFLALSSDLAAAQGYLEQAREADPTNPDTLYTLAEVYFAQAQPERAVETMQTYLALPEGAGDAQGEARLATMQALAPALRRATGDPTAENLLALADAYWETNERERAADIYLRVLSTQDPHSGVALSRVGQLLFTGGRAEEAAELLGRAQALGRNDLDTLLFLGNARFSLADYEGAIAAWEDYVAVAGGAAAAGRVPDLIESARARLAQGEPSAQVTGASLFAAHCAACHGALAQGGSGPRLAGSPRAAHEGNVSSAIRQGRGMMPGFAAQLEEAELETLTRYVVDELAQP